jgi:hypothetical protein
MDIKTPGVFALTDLMTAGQLTSFALNVEKHRYGSLWFPEGSLFQTLAIPVPTISFLVTVRMCAATANGSRPSDRDDERGPLRG